MEKGFNSDLLIAGLSYHVQTEDWGWENPFVVTRIYHNGAVIQTIKTSYSVLIRQGPVSSQQAIQLGMKEQHHRILDQLVAG